MRYTLVIFDMDGTLTEELLDFDQIRRDLGFPAAVPILEQIAGLTMDEQRRAHEILDLHETAAAESCRLHDGAAETLAELRQKNIRTALLTRNSRLCAERILGRHGLTFDHISTRENLPHKPHPESILSITRRFAAGLQQTLMVGDYLYDLQAARAAGTDSALVCLRDGGKRPDFSNMATYCIEKLHDVLKLVEGEPK